MAVREFTDSRGVDWRAWDVMPSHMHPVTRGEDYMANLQDGWLVFECGREKRRLEAPYPRDWSTLPIPELEELCRRAMPVRRVREKSQSGQRRAVSAVEIEQVAIAQEGGRRTFRSPAGREWTVQVSVNPADLPEARRIDTGLYSGIGLMAAAMLGALLLVVSGRTQRIEAAVAERTADLQAEVAERELAQAAMRESEERFRNIFNTVPIGVVYTDLDGQVERANPQFLQLLDCTEDELRTMRPADYMHQDDFDEAAALTRALLAGRLSIYRQHCRYHARNGRTVLARATVSVLRDAHGEPQRIVRVMEDVTEQLRRQEAEKARDVAEAANQAKSEFLSRMSHELRTPLNAMLGFAQLLEMDRRSPLAAHQKQWIEQVQRAGWHLLEMINDVLDLSRIESGNLRLQSEPLNLSELVDEALAMIVASAEQRSIVLRVELAPGTSTVLGDATRIKQILINLLSNAVKYNHDQGQIGITSRLRGADSVDIVVTDSGLGMTAEQLAGLFQPFNRLGRERSALEGTGIGLVVSLRLAELMVRYNIGVKVLQSYQFKRVDLDYFRPEMQQPETLR